MVHRLHGVVDSVDCLTNNPGMRCLVWVDAGHDFLIFYRNRCFDSVLVVFDDNAFVLFLVGI